MSRNAKLAIIFSAVGAAVGIGVMIIIAYNQTAGEMFLRLLGEKDDNSGNLDSEPALGSLSRYRAVLAVGEEGTYSAVAKYGKAPFSFEWKFSDGLTLTGQTVTRSFDLPGKYTFHLTVTDSTGKKDTTTELYTNVVQETPNKGGTGNITITH